jgi:hypothetical protein
MQLLRLSQLLLLEQLSIFLDYRKLFLRSDDRDIAIIALVVVIERITISHKIKREMQRGRDRG